MDAIGRFSGFHGHIIVDIAPSNHAGLSLFALHNHTMVRLMFGKFDGSIQQRFVLNNTAGLDSTRGGDYCLSATVFDPDSKLACRKSTKNYRVYCPDPSASQHCYGCLNNHRHIYDHPVTLGDTKFFQDACEPCCLV